MATRPELSGKCIREALRKNELIVYERCYDSVGKEIFAKLIPFDAIYTPRTTLEALGGGGITQPKGTGILKNIKQQICVRDKPRMCKYLKDGSLGACSKDMVCAEWQSAYRIGNITVREKVIIHIVVFAIVGAIIWMYKPKTKTK